MKMGKGSIEIVAERVIMKNAGIATEGAEVEVASIEDATLATNKVHTDVLVAGQ